MSGPTPPDREQPATGSHYQPSLGVVLIIIVLFVGAAFFMLRAVSPSSSSASTTTTVAGSTSTTSTTTPARVVKSKTLVQVANGTEVSALAATYTQKLTILDWDTLSPINGPSEKTTVIYYRAGFLQAAEEIASEIKVADSAIHPLGKLNPVTGAASDDVIVILGLNSSKG